MRIVALAVIALVALPAIAQQPADPSRKTVVLDRAGYVKEGDIALSVAHDFARFEWPAGGGRRLALNLSLVPGTPLFRRIELERKAGDGFAPVATDLSPVFTVTAGSRKVVPDRFVFFDKPADRPHTARRVELDFAKIRFEGGKGRASAAFGPATAGSLAGELVVRVCAGSPLVHIEAALAPDADGIAYIYDAVLEGEYGTAAWLGIDDQWHREKPRDVRSVAVRRRSIFAEGDGGSLGVFPPPHAFFFPRDYTTNFRFAQAGPRVVGLRQDPDGGGAFVPWFDAPRGRVQRMGMFLLADGGKAEDAMAAVERYTRGDAFKPMDGRITFTSHWHSRLAVSELAGKPRAPEFVNVMKAMGVDAVHLAEFHGDGHRDDAGETRLKELKAMFDVCRKYSDGQCLLIPGEEGNRWLARPSNEKEHPGHWVYLFPKPVYLTWGPPVEGAAKLPFQEDVNGYGRVYHVSSTADMVALLKEEQGLAWTTHPRIKASYATPDVFRAEDWYKSPLFLGAAWKAMPGDLSDARMGKRALDCLDDMLTWGQKKWLPGEVDVFEIDASHELYGPMNINYLQVARRPTADDWSPVLDALREGRFFVTTGEILIHKCDARADRVTADVEWTFPLAIAVVAWGDAAGAHLETISLEDTGECDRRTFGLPVDLSKALWARLEVWDIAGNGAFTQPQWFK